MPRTSLDREVLLEQLIAHAAETIRADPESSWLRLILRKGFAGFETMSGPQLERELQLRGLQPPIESADSDAHENDFSEDWDLSRELPSGLSPDAH
jgi:hypothetical protein